MRRRDYLRSIGSSAVILSVGEGSVVASMDEQREAAITHISNEHNVAEEHLKVLVESVVSWITLREEYYQAKVGCRRIE